VADHAQNIEHSHLSDRFGVPAQTRGEASAVARSSTGWLSTVFKKNPYRFAVSCTVLFTLAGVALGLMMTPSSEPEKLTQIRIQFNVASTQQSDSKTLMTVAQNAVLSDEGSAELAQQIINDGLVLTFAHEATWWGLFGEVVLGKVPTPSDPILRARHDMRGRISLSQAADGSAIFVTTSAETSAASARFAQHAANRIVTHINASATGSVQGHNDSNRALFENAEAAVTGFQVRHGNDAMAKMEAATQDLALVSGSVAELESRLADVAHKLSNLTLLQGDKALAREIPDDTTFLPLQDAVRQYVAASKALAQLSVQYGPKHPHVIAATQTQQETKANAARALKSITSELKQQEQAAKAELAQARNKQKALEQKLAVFGDAPAELNRLEADLSQTRETYFNGLADSDPKSTQAAAPFAVANAPLAVNIPAGFRQMISMAVIGGGCGLGLGVLTLVALYIRFRKREVSVPAHESANGPDIGFYTDTPQPDAIFPQPESDDALDYAEEDFATPETADAYDLAYEIAANDLPLDQRVREVLMRRSIKASPQDIVDLPPMLAAAMRGQFEVQSSDKPAFSQPVYDEPDEVLEVRRDIAALRQRLHDYANRRAAS
jgi:hypothetical protein